MKRLHVNLAVSDLDKSIRFYSTLFGSPPTVRKSDYAKWLLDDPHVNLSVSTRGARAGIDHLGIEVDNAAELGEVHARLEAAGGPLLEEGGTTCCYARSDKTWTADPEGVEWETFYTHGESPVYGGGRDIAALAARER